jgi:hypothetical protein
VTVLRLARSELKRMTGGLLPKLTVMALTLVPLLYGAVYLYANWNPYGNLDRIDAALVVEDAGADAGNGTRLEAGQKVADSLLDGHVFNWQTVPTPRRRTRASATESTHSRSRSPRISPPTSPRPAASIPQPRPCSTSPPTTPTTTC